MVPKGSKFRGWDSLEKGNSKSGQKFSTYHAVHLEKTTGQTGGMTQIPATKNPKPKSQVCVEINSFICPYESP